MQPAQAIAPSWLHLGAGLNDPRVGYWEPAKFVAKLREYKTDSNMLLFKCEMGAGEVITKPMATCAARKYCQDTVLLPLLFIEL